MKTDRTPAHGIHSEYQVICPYCHYEPDETYPPPNGDSEIEECGSCEKKYYTSAEIRYSSKRDCKLNNQACDWQSDDSMNVFADRKYNWFKCPNCLDTHMQKLLEGEKK